MQHSFFSDDSLVIAIPGLQYIPNFICQEEAQYLLTQIDQQNWSLELKRRVQHYGYHYDYKAKNITKKLHLGALPEWLNSYCEQLQTQSFFPKTPDQVIINEYQPGQGISPHIDCIPCFEETIASLSLRSECVMDFIHTSTGEKMCCVLEPRSLLLLSGEARYLWRHGIAARKTDRYKGEILVRGRRVSLTFRNVVLS